MKKIFLIIFALFTSQIYSACLEEEVMIAGEVTLSGTLTMPITKGPFPTVILIAGSGPVDRDETLFGHKPFLVLADHLTRKGIAVLRYDKRGIEKSTGNYEIATTEDFANDTWAAIQYLKSRPEIDKDNIGLIGHSEGGLIAPMLADDVNFIVLMGAPGVNGTELMLEQGRLIQQAEGFPQDLIDKEDNLRRVLFEIIKNESNPEIALREAFLKYGNTDFEASIQQLNTPWFRYFLKYDPQVMLRQVKIPVLAINGELDLQVSSKQNLTAIAQAVRNCTVIELPHHNHLFQICKTGSPTEYMTIKETISPLTLKTISDWIMSL